MSGPQTETIKPLDRAQVYSDIVGVLRMLKWRVDVRRVLIFSAEDAPPIPRIEIDVHDSRNTKATADIVAAALQEWGLTLQAGREPGAPLSEIWLTFPGNHGTALMCLGGSNHNSEK